MAGQWGGENSNSSYRGRKQRIISYKIPRRRLVQVGNRFRRNILIFGVSGTKLALKEAVAD